MKRSQKNLRLIKEARPDLEVNDDLKIAASTLDEIEELVVFSETEGGMVLRNRLIKSTGALLGNAFSILKRAHDPQELVTILARMEAQLNVLIDLENAKNNLEQQRTLVDTIIEQSI